MFNNFNSTIYAFFFVQNHNSKNIPADQLKSNHFKSQILIVMFWQGEF